VCLPVDPSHCATNDDCPADYVCTFLHPTDPDCSPDDPVCQSSCPPGSTCDDSGTVASGVCAPKPSSCAEDRDCLSADGETLSYCIHGECVLQLDCDPRNAYCDMIPPVCPPGSVITVVDGCFGPCVDPKACLPLDNICVSNKDCPSGHDCLLYCSECASTDPACRPGCEGFCVPVKPECISGTECHDPSTGLPGQCVDGKCVIDSQSCTDRSQCPSGWVCESDSSSADCQDSSGLACPMVCMPPPSEECFRTGCALEICSDRAVESDCVWRPEYRCYDLAICERGTDGVCGFSFPVDAHNCLQDVVNP
jgi:hypothetical protein